MVPALLIDDEPDALDMLEWQLNNYCPQVKVVAKCRSADEGIAAITALKPALVFLDIEMPRKNGFEVIRSFPDPNFDIVFTTAYNQFAVQAFKVSALDYLMKPIDADDLVKTLQRFEKKQQAISLKAQLAVLIKEYESPKKAAVKIHFPTQEGIVFAAPETILRAESTGNYTTIYFNGDRKLTLAKTLKDVEEMLLPHGFVRIHHSHIVNTAFISKYLKSDGGIVVMQDGVKLPVSRQRKDDFVKFFSGE